MLSQKLLGNCGAVACGSTKNPRVVRPSSELGSTSVGCQISFQTRRTSKRPRPDRASFLSPGELAQSRQPLPGSIRCLAGMSESNGNSNSNSRTPEQYPEREWSAPSSGPADGAPVQLRVYNIDRWGLAPMGARLLKKHVDGIYHVGIAVRGCEYWFDHQVNMLQLGEVDYVRGFGPAYVYDMGRTSLSRQEIDDFVFGQMQREFNIDTYDCFYHNCHHFANDVCVKLTGNRIPQWCIDHGEQGLSELSEESAKMTRMISNKIARIMMVSWGRYNKERFVNRRGSDGQSAGLSAIDPVPLAGRSAPVDAIPEGVTNDGLNKLLGGELLQKRGKGSAETAGQSVV